MNIQLRRHKRTLSTITGTGDNERSKVSINHSTNSQSTAAKKFMRPETTSGNLLERRVNVSSIGPDTHGRKYKALKEKEKSFSTYHTKMDTDHRPEFDYVKGNPYYQGRFMSVMHDRLDSNSQSQDSQMASGILDVGKLLDDKFKNYLNNKAVERERLRMARLRVAKQEETMRETLRSKFLDSERKRDEVMKNLSKQKLNKVKKTGERNKEIELRLAQLKKDFVAATKEKNKNLKNKMDNSARNKERVDEAKHRLTVERNQLTSERQSFRLEMKEHSADYLLDTLSEIEDNVASRRDKKRQLLEDKMVRSRKHSIQVEERHQKALVEKKSGNTNLIQKLGEKMSRIRSKSTMGSTSQLNTDSQKEIRKSTAERLKEITNQRRLEEKERLKKFNEREKQLMERMEKRKFELSDYQSEKRGEWDQKLSMVRNNKRVTSAKKERQVEESVWLYKDRVDQINANKLHRRRMMERFDKGFGFGEESNLILNY